MGNLRELAVQEGILNEKQAARLIKSFDIMGDIAILDIPDELRKKERRIAELVLREHRNIKVIAKKESEIGGKYRVRKLKVIAGEKRLITTHRENGCAFVIDLGKVYFSPRQSFERDRIAKQVKMGEKVLALFAGAGFYPIEIAKLQKDCEIIAVELNPAAVKYMEQNVRLNKVQDSVSIVEGDVKKILGGRKYKKWATRAIMPLPHTAHEFLPTTISCTKKGGIVHFYHIPKTRSDALNDAKEKIASACKKSRRSFKILSSRIVKAYAPHVDEIVVDFRLTN